ncbi:MAG: adenylate/guanylate cyclase domain-containing protein [Chlamydiales bacterium]|nr:adenylate/guanylate cyclase domain-containing protein [Chlamydiales bacterium]
MKLRTKLLLGVGLLFFLMAIVMYFLPTFLVRRDVVTAADQVHALLIKEHRQLLKSQELWLENESRRTLQNLNSILYILYEEPAFSDTLVFKKNNSLLNVWQGVARVAGYDPEIGFVQAHSPKINQTALVLPHTAEMYPIVKIGEKEDMALIAMRQKDEEKVPHKLYLGIVLPEDYQNERGYTLYALIDIDKAEEVEPVLKEISELHPEKIKPYLDKAEELLSDQVERDPSAYFWAIKINLIRTLTPLVLEGFLIEHTEEEYIPAGIGRLDASETGVALLADDVYRTTPLFDDSLYYETHPPHPDDPPLAEGSALVTISGGNHAFVANTLLLKNTFISIGVSFSHVMRQLALSSNQTILLNVNREFWLGFDENGQKLDEIRVEEIVKGGLFDQNGETFTFNDQLFSSVRIGNFYDGNLVFYAVRPMERDQSIIGTLFALENKLSNRISLQLSLITVGTMILVLLFIGRIGFTVIYPVTKLAQATEDVVSGRYGEIYLPDVGKRKDEVATLIRSFSSMVEGLREREKIRGVLDKVVSKDVAEEILRTQIHLGGEDRIVTMLFSDIRNFTELVEKATPQKTIEMLNGCMTKISRVIEGEGGVIDKYVGDEVMAIFGAPTSHPDHALRAVASGMLIIETLKQWNQERILRGEPALEMGIGINTGLVVAGNMGAEDRLNYTVLGSNVNLASRLCHAAKPNQLIISEATLAEPNVAESFIVKSLEPIVLKGIKKPVSIYEVVGFKWEGA